jgi:hypothetical protein
MAEDPITWTALKADIALWLNRDDLTTQIPVFIAYAERHFNRNVFTPDREAALSITADAQSEALPADFWGFKSGPYIDGSPDTILTRLTPGDLRATYPAATTGTPAHFAVEGENILFGPTPSSAVAIKGTYYAVIAPLASGTATNWLLTDHPDLYLAGALHYAWRYCQFKEEANEQLALMQAFIEDINKAGRRRSVNSGPLVATHSVGHVRHIQA